VHSQSAISQFLGGSKNDGVRNAIAYQIKEGLVYTHIYICIYIYVYTVHIPRKAEHVMKFISETSIALHVMGTVSCCSLLQYVAVCCSALSSYCI